MTENLSKQQHIVEKNMKQTTESVINESVNKEDNDNVKFEPNISNESIEIKEEDIKLELDSDTFCDEQDSITEQSPSTTVEFVEMQIVKTEKVDEYDAEEDPIKITEGTFTCDYCKRAFTTSEYCQKHRKRCKDRVYNQPSTSATSIPDEKLGLTNDGEKLYQCDKCDNKYKSQSGLYLHQRRHSGVGLHTCSECHKQFATPSDLAQHLLIHTGEKPHKCTQCGDAFNSVGHLNTHLLRHTGARPHKCMQCGKSFTLSGTLRTHMRTHTGERPYQCTQCSKAFTDSGSLSRHMRTHSGHKPYRCTVCRWAFAQSNSLKIHMKTHSKKTRNKP